VSVVVNEPGNCDIDFFIFRCDFSKMRPKFTKFKRDQIVAEIFQIGINESEKVQKSTKGDKIII
jgi:hypothetical protein